MEKSNLSLKQKPEKRHYILAISISIGFIIIATIFYVFSSFSSIRQSINELQELPNVESAFYQGDINSLIVKCSNGKEFQIELEDTITRYSPIVADFCR